MATFTEKLSVIVESGTKIWYDDDRKYPIFNEAFRSALNQKIVDHYWNYEIGQETVEMFRHALNRKMREIMPYYNKLYLSEIDIDPLQTIDVTTTGETGGSETNTSTSDNNTDSGTSSKSRSVGSDTPQTRLMGDEDYATSATDAVSEASAQTVAHGEVAAESISTGNVESTTKGSQGHAATLLMQYRNSILNIDMNVIRDLETLFMQIWDNGDSFSGKEVGFSVYPYYRYPYI